MRVIAVVVGAAAIGVLGACSGAPDAPEVHGLGAAMSEPRELQSSPTDDSFPSESDEAVPSSVEGARVPGEIERALVADAGSSSVSGTVPFGPITVGPIAIPTVDAPGILRGVHYAVSSTATCTISGTVGYSATASGQSWSVTVGASGSVSVTCDVTFGIYRYALIARRSRWIGVGSATVSASVAASISATAALVQCPNGVLPAGSAMLSFGNVTLSLDAFNVALWGPLGRDWPVISGIATNMATSAISTQLASVQGTINGYIANTFPIVVSSVCASSPDAGADAGPVADSGTPADSGAGMLLDSGLVHDSGMVLDSGMVHDSGMVLDSGMTEDSGTFAIDSGRNVDEDASAEEDTGSVVVLPEDDAGIATLDRGL